VRRGQPGAQRELRVRAVDAGHPRVGDESELAFARHEHAEVLERADSDADAAGREDDVVGIACARVGRLAVERVALREQLAKAGLVLREGPVAAAGAAPGILDVDVQVDGDGSLPEQPTGRVARHRAAAERDYGRPVPPQGSAHGFGLEHAEGGLASLAEDLRHRPARLPLDLAVEVDELTLKAAGDLPPDGRLAGAHEADQGDVLV
jgi:hypothetical protein